MLPGKLKSFIRDYFTLTSRERKGALSLLVIIFLQACTIFYFKFFSDPSVPDISQVKIEVFKFEEKINALQKEKKLSQNFNRDEPKNTIKVSQYFNPNTISDKEWMQMGLTTRQTSVIRNYLDKGGKFRDKDDVAKIYGITPEMFLLLEPWILIVKPKEKNSNKVYENKTNENKKIIKINLNTADTLQLINLPLVGAGRARMIFKYREALGGFISPKQLLEVFTIDSAVYETILPFLIIDASSIRKININSDQLKHPYLPGTVANAIKAYRKQHGNYVSAEGLKQLALMDEQLYAKLAPYISIE